MNPSTFTPLCEALHRRSEELAGRDIQPSDLLTDLGIDSLERLSLVVDVETCFGVQIDDADLDAVHSVEDLALLVERLQATGSPA
ncbi:acyl carrier protein [Kitasatospora sp. NPDC093550]|uniref:acyl carrier protein n=1 Tax=Kitasatospora sp. NPDC093550 TaxID=3364089 RepID=UPI00382A9390